MGEDDDEDGYDEDGYDEDDDDEDDYDEEDYDEVQEYSTGNNGDDEYYLDNREYPIQNDEPMSTETPKTDSSKTFQSSSCVDQKVWCRFADCSLENVKRSCQKTCNICP